MAEQPREDFPRLGAEVQIRVAPTRLLLSDQTATGTHIGHGLVVHPDPYCRWPWSVSDLVTGAFVACGISADVAEREAYERIKAKALPGETLDGFVDWDAVLRRARARVLHARLPEVSNG